MPRPKDSGEVKASRIAHLSLQLAAYWTRVTSPKWAKNYIFFQFLRRFWALGPVPEPSPGPDIEFPVKNG